MILDDLKTFLFTLVLGTARNSSNALSRVPSFPIPWAIPSHPIPSWLFPLIIPASPHTSLAQFNYPSMDKRWGWGEEVTPRPPSSSSGDSREVMPARVEVTDLEYERIMMAQALADAEAPPATVDVPSLREFRVPFPKYTRKVVY